MSENLPELESIGKNVKKLRTGAKMSMDDLSGASGVSKAMLSQIEAGKVNPTVATLWKIAQAFRVDFNVLLRGEGNRIKLFTVYRREDLTSLDVGHDGVDISVLSPPSLADNLEMYMLTFAKGSVLDSEPHTQGSQEFVTVLEGKIKVTAGDRSSILNEGDLVNYQCDVHHRIENLSQKPSRVHMLVYFLSKA